LSSLVWLIVALATPAPVVIQDVARMGAKRIQEKLPPEIRERIKEQRISPENKLQLLATLGSHAIVQQIVIDRMMADW